MVPYILECGESLDDDTAGGQTPLAIATSKGHLEIVRALLKAKADVYYSRRRKIRPLYPAAFGGHIKVVSEIIKTGAEVNTCTLRGTTPFYDRVSHPEVVKLLFQADADVNLLIIMNKLHHTLQFRKGLPIPPDHFLSKG